MAQIKIMDVILSNKIAAGEVVERCSSVVKELTENAIDAKSKTIRIDLKEAGTKQIKVTDDGIGMDKEDAVIAFERHATSKLIDENDLYRIHTLGFRGEALPSIASVSKIDLKTSNGKIGTHVIIEGGILKEVKKGDARKGTIIEVNDLFYNTPARLKHMKSLYTELASITDYIHKLALSYPNIKFILTNNDNTLLNTDGSGNILKTFSAIFGVNTAKKMLSIEGENEDYSISGYISMPEIHRASRNHMILIVNGRIVRNMEINRAINDAYHSYKPDNRYPIVLIYIDVDSSLIDVNIHPTKMDIKFSKIENLITILTKAIEKALKKEILIPEIETNEKEIEEKPKIYEEVTLNLERVYENTKPLEGKEKLEEIKEPKKEEAEEKIEETQKKLPEMYPIGSIHGTYLVCQNEKGMYLIDQHAAKERINYEIVLNKLKEEKPNITDLLLPITLELTASEYIIFKENINIMRQMGFVVEEFGVNSIIIKSHPTWLTKFKEEEAIKRIVDLIIHLEKNFNIERFKDHVAATMACKMSIKANDTITVLEMENLINDLRKCENPFHCPHGRPTIVYFSKSDLEKFFKRSGFDGKQ